MRWIITKNHMLFGHGNVPMVDDRLPSSRELPFEFRISDPAGVTHVEGRCDRKIGPEDVSNFQPLMEVIASKSLQFRRVGAPEWESL